MAEERTFQIQLEGLIQLLAQNLYADPDVFLREMIQNAHDSITRRAELAAERGEPDPPAPRIQVVADPDAQQIRIHDNGSGLTRDEIDGYLSTIGRSGTNELRQRIAAADRTRTVELIGQFGIGLLSAFIVAERVTVVTKAAGHDAARWQSTLPIIGVDGSLATVQAGGPATGKIFAKTGTLAAGNFFNDQILFPAKALGGYMDARSGRRLAFAIVAANSVFSTIEGAFAANDDVGKVPTIIQQSF